MAPSVTSEPLSQEDLLAVKNAPFAYRNNTWKPPVAKQRIEEDSLEGVEPDVIVIGGGHW